MQPVRPGAPMRSTVSDRGEQDQRSAAAAGRLRHPHGLCTPLRVWRRFDGHETAMRAEAGACVSCAPPAAEATATMRDTW